MDNLNQWSIVPVWDAAEPDYHVQLGMDHRYFDAVTVFLVPDGVAGQPGLYGTDESHDGRPTKPLLLFYRGCEPPLVDIAECLEAEPNDASPSILSQGTLEDYGEDQATRSIKVDGCHSAVLDEARLGMEMGRYFDTVEFDEDSTEPTETDPGVYTFRFYRSEHALRSDHRV